MSGEAAPGIRLTLTGVLAAAGGVVLVGGGLVAGYPAFVGLGAAAVTAVVVALVLVVMPPRLEVTRSVNPSRVSVGEQAIARLSVRNTGRLPLLGFDAYEQIDGAPLWVAVPAISPGRTADVTYPVEARYRGLVSLGPVVLERRDPMGLARRVAALSDTRTLWVHPRLHPMRPLPVGTVPDFEGRLADRAPQGSTAFASLREYKPGDDPRQIHWRSTARLGTLLVRLRVDTSEPTTAVVLDTRSTTFDTSTFEAAVEVAASVITATRRVGHRVSLDALGEDLGRVRRAGGRDPLDRLAAVRQCSSARPADLGNLMLRALGGGSLIVVTGEDSAVPRQAATVTRRFARTIVVQVGATGGAVHCGSVVIVRVTDAAAIHDAFTPLLGGRV
jgi:uncharacterized protein (DUF58 family)